MMLKTKILNQMKKSEMAKSEWIPTNGDDSEEAERKNVKL